MLKVTDFLLVPDQTAAGLEIVKRWQFVAYVACIGIIHFFLPPIAATMFVFFGHKNSAMYKPSSTEYEALLKRNFTPPVIIVSFSLKTCVKR